jgi:two-component system nitrate/nitrite response regulator NarL
MDDRPMPWLETELEIPHIRMASTHVENGTKPHQDRRPLRLLLVDDHDLFRTGLRSLLEEQGFETADAASGDAAIELCRSLRPDVVVMDMNMPGMSGVEATRMLTAEHPRVAVLMLTVAADDDSVLDAVRAGASGYLLKDARLPEIVAAVRAAAAGESVFASRVAGVLVSSVRKSSRRPATHARDELTARERDVLALLAEGYDNSEIAAQLYVSASTVKNHVSNVLEKLGLDNRVQAAAFAIRSGIVA